MNIPHKIGCVVLGLLLSIPFMHAQDELEALLRQEVEIIDPVYKPVVGAGIGVINYFGDIKNDYISPGMGTLGYKVNLMTYIDNKRYFQANFFFIGGKITGNERSEIDLTKNYNFQTDLLIFGINMNYDFDHLYKRYSRFHPFISIGFEMMNFSPKYDSLLSRKNYSSTLIEKYAEGSAYYNEVPYYYWSDGTIRDEPELVQNYTSSVEIKRDFDYETNMRDIDFGLDREIPEFGFAIPVDVGFDYYVTDRIMLRVGNSFHFTFTDFLDNISSENTRKRIGDKKLDMFNFTYVSAHFDLFSEAKVKFIERLFADVEEDYTIMYGDEDNDGWFDGWDDCPQTPPGVETDTTGCPLDDDNDGVPNYLDEEPNTPYGAIVNDQGIQMRDDDIIAMVDQSSAVDRKDIALYIRKPESYSSYRAGQFAEIPPQYKSIDTDGDSYISFDEMMDEIDKFFDFESDLSSDEIYNLNDFFFSQ